MAGSDAHRDRLTAALRENLKKRKARARAVAPAAEVLSVPTPAKPLSDSTAKASPLCRPNAASNRD
jgi:hypothetical protein